MIAAGRKSQFSLTVGVAPGRLFVLQWINKTKCISVVQIGLTRFLTKEDTIWEGREEGLSLREVEEWEQI